MAVLDMSAAVMAQWLPWLVAFAAGLGTGILSAFGIGGGTLLLLVMTLLLQVEGETARAINLLYFLPTAALSLYQHRKNGYLNGQAIKSAVPLGLLLAVLGVVVGAMLDTRLLRKAFGLYLLWAGVSVLFSRKKAPISRRQKREAH